MERRLQGDPRPARRPLLRLKGAAAVLLLGTLAASAILGATEVVPRVEDGIAHDSKLTATARRHAAAVRLRLDPVPFDAFRSKLRPRERYAVDVPPGEKGGPFITKGQIVRAYSAFFFLPAIQTHAAERVFRYRFR